MIILSSLILSLFGLFNLLGINKDLFFRQLIFVFVGFLIYFLIKKIKKFFFINRKDIFYWFFITLLLIIFIIGVEIKGSKRWFDFGFFSLQPSELFKPFFILFFADFLSKKYLFKNYYLLIFKSIIYFFIPFFIIFKQPDLGTALTYLMIYLLMLFFSQIPKKYLISFFISLVAFIPLVWFFLKDYQKARLIAFINPSIDIQGISYNIIQSIISIGSGQFFGRGLGLGTQSKLFFLPENATDFAFASLIEQFGFFGGFFVIFFYLLIFLQLFRKIFYNYYHNKGNFFNFYYLIGLLAYLSFQFFLNIGMNLGIMPVAGIPLPFISYGGSAIITIMISFAFLD